MFGRKKRDRKRRRPHRLRRSKQPGQGAQSRAPRSGSPQPATYRIAAARRTADGEPWYRSSGGPSTSPSRCSPPNRAPARSGAALDTGIRDSAAAALSLRAPHVTEPAPTQAPPAGLLPQPTQQARASSPLGHPGSGPVGDGRVDQPTRRFSDPDGCRADRSAAGATAGGPSAHPAASQTAPHGGGGVGRPGEDRHLRRPGRAGIPGRDGRCTERRRRRRARCGHGPRVTFWCWRGCRRRRPRALRARIAGRPTPAGRPPSCAPPTASR